MTQVSQVMTRGVRTLSPGDSMQFAAQAMDELNIGAVPVCDGERLVGIVTDRDITVRGVAHGRPADQTPLSEVMTPEVCWCYEDQPIEEVAVEMEETQIRRMPVVDREKHLVGMVSLGDVAVKADRDQAGEALAGVSQPAEPDRSGTSAASGAAGGGSATGAPSRKPG
jgi:CBS domain-containing protein